MLHWGRYAQQTGLTCTPHQLRHTHATLMLKSHVPAKIVSSILGHSSIGITMDTYSHVLTEMQEPATGAWNKILQDVSKLY